MKKCLIILCSITLFGCASTVQLRTPGQNYTEYKYISDERTLTKDSSLISSNQLGAAVELLLAGPYGAGAYQYDTDNMSPVADGKFSISPVLALDMKLDELFKISGNQPSPVHLHTFIIQTKERFLGRGPINDHADCVIELTYLDTPFRVYEKTGLTSFDYESTLGSFVSRCIETVVGQIGEHNQRNKK
jgi:hypothetical protein